MTLPLKPYLSVLQVELSGLAALDNLGNSNKQNALYSQRLVGMLQHNLHSLPDLQQQALIKYAVLLDDLCAELASVNCSSLVTAELIRHLRTEPNYNQAEVAIQNAVSLLIQNHTINTQRLLSEISEINSSLHDDFFNGAKDNQDSVSNNNEKKYPLSPQQIAALQVYIRRTFSNNPELLISEVTAITAGASKQTLILHLVDLVDLPSTLILRADREMGVVKSSVVDEFFIVNLVYEAGVCVPKPYCLEATGEIIGSPFILVEHVDGQSIGDWTDITSPSREYAIDMAHTFARLHQIPESDAKGRLPGSDCSSQQRIESDLDMFETSWRTSGQTSIALEQAYGWLRQNISAADGQRAIIHCDPGIHNMLGKDGRLAALLDWETAAIGHPAQDLTYIRPKVEQMMPWDEFMQEYINAGGTLPDEKTMNFYMLWQGVFANHYNSMARAFFHSGAVSSLMHAYVSQYVYHFYYQQLQKTIDVIYQKGL